MDVRFQHRGRKLSNEDIAFIRALIKENRTASRRALSKKLCEAWNWVQPNGGLRDMVCRSLMLELERAGHIALPPVRWINPNPLARRRRPDLPDIDTASLAMPLAAIRPLVFQLVRRTAEEPLFNGLVEHYHYLGYTQPVGEHLKYLVYGAGHVVGCLAWSSAPRHLGPRDRFIGWSAEARLKNIRFIAYNTRFLIPPWIRIPHLASHILGRMPVVVSRDWERIYGHPIYFLETFIDPARSRGTCYRAANWIMLGRTTGRGKDSQSKKPNRSIKDVLGYPVWKRFRERLGDVA
jgi:hypothetical protein